MKIHKDAVIDAALLFVGSAVGAAASTAYMIHRWLRKTHHGLPPEEAR